MLVIVVGGIPIAMPTVLSVTLALGAAKLAKEGAIVARMSAVEEMAGMDMLCSDKTGMNSMPADVWRWRNTMSHNAPMHSSCGVLGIFLASLHLQWHLADVVKAALWSIVRLMSCQPELACMRSAVDWCLLSGMYSTLI